MGFGDFGFSSLNNILNPNFNNGFGISNLSILDTFITSARVKSIVLNDSHPRFKELGEWTALGAIEYELVKNPVSFSKLSIAYPLYPNIKNYPLLEEIVYIITLPNTEIGSNNASQKTYYSNIAIWNHPHHNAYPIISNIVPSSQNKDYSQTQAGSTSNPTNQPTQIFLGKTFVEKPNIHPLLPFEGDVIHEGRWGNSIRLGSTVKNNPNNWSSTGNNGDPIVILRNGQGFQLESQGWDPIVENINNDESSIYLTSTQNIPLKASSTDYTSYSNGFYTSTGEIPIVPSKYEGNQIILNSGRLVFNSSNDHILLSSNKSINLNSLKSVNIDTRKFVVQADNIYLGEIGIANQHLMLGDNTVEFLRTLVSSLKDMANYLKTLTSDPVTANNPATFNSTLLPKATQLAITLESLESQLNANPPVLISQRNFTL